MSFIEEKVEELRSKIVDISEHEGVVFTHTKNIDDDEVCDWLRDTLTAILTKAKEVIEEKKGYDINSTNFDAGSNTLNEVFNEGYNQALSDAQASLDELLTKEPYINEDHGFTASLDDSGLVDGLTPLK